MGYKSKHPKLERQRIQKSLNAVNSRITRIEKSIIKLQTEMDDLYLKRLALKSEKAKYKD